VHLDLIGDGIKNSRRWLLIPHRRGHLWSPVVCAAPDGSVTDPWGHPLEVTTYDDEVVADAVDPA